MVSAPSPARAPLVSRPTCAATEQLGATVEAAPPAPRAQVSTSRYVCVLRAYRLKACVRCLSTALVCSALSYPR